MSEHDINDLRVQRKELRARFFPSQIPVAQVARPKPDDQPIAKDIRVDPMHEPMDAEEFARKMRRGEFPKSEANYRRLIGKLAEEHGFTYEDIVGHARPKKLAEARFHIYWYMTQKMKVSENGTGRLMHKDHHTVRHGLARWQAMLDAKREKK